MIKVWEGGLASHGAAIGIPLSIYLLTKKQKDKTMLWILDRVVVVVALAAVLIRLGNLFNSEILGTAADVPWAFIFARVDNVPRHPAQLYEAIFYLISFIILYFVYYKTDKKSKQGFLFGLFLILIFGFRFFIEFLKIEQSAFEKGMILDMGQLLSIPFILGGLYYMFRKGKEIENKKVKSKTAH
jgi:prolipoprotein diacylglyceryl transferase